jgi:hypothetical protein
MHKQPIIVVPYDYWTISVPVAPVELWGRNRVRNVWKEWNSDISARDKDKDASNWDVVERGFVSSGGYS